jgi:dienelactone hydrolase
MNRVALTLIAVVALRTSPQASAQALPETIAPLPEPTGHWAVGTVVAYLTDTTRRDGDFASGRPITVQLWYPAANSLGAPAAYLIEKGLGDTLVSTDYYGIDTTALKKWPTVRTHSHIGAPAMAGNHPLITFSVGAGVARANYTSIAEELASHGYIVALVESPLAGMMMLPSGRVITDTAGRFQTPAAHRTGVALWSRDISFALDQLHSRSLTPEVKRVAETIDWTRIGATGHSSGGLVAIAACESDPRVRACVNLDGGMASPEQEPMADFVATGTTKPTLLLRSKPLYSDADFARRGLTREQWEKRGEGGRIALDSVFARARGPLWMGFVAGTGHMSFSDAPFVMPSAISRFGGKIIAAQRGLLVITSVMRAFFDQELGHATNAVDELSKLSARFPEVTITRIKP